MDPYGKHVTGAIVRSTRFHTFYTVRPYLDTAPPSWPREVRYQVDTWHEDRVRVVSVDASGEEVVRFDAGGYRPGALGRSDVEMAADVAGFARAYVERPVEFDRRTSHDDHDVEQSPDNAAWWSRHGDAVTPIEDAVCVECDHYSSECDDDGVCPECRS